MENFGKFMAIMLTLIVSPIISGFVLMKLWEWFVVTTFDIDQLSIAQVIGLAMIINFLKTKRDKDETTDFWGDFGKNVTYLILMSGFTLLIGWIVQMFL